MVTVSYCSKDQWAQRKARTDWDTYASENKYPDAEALQQFLVDTTVTINDLDHVGCTSTNITNTEYTEWLEALCYKMTNRSLMVELNQGAQAGQYSFSPQDLMYNMERTNCWNIGTAEGYRSRGGSV